MKKIDFLTDFSLNILSRTTNLLYNVHFENESVLKGYAHRGFVLLPKHQSNLDIVLEGMLLKSSINRHGNYIMKDSLPKILEYVGGIGITRIKDLNKKPGYYDREIKHELLAAARERRERVDEELLRLIRMEEIIVIHVEGKRYYQTKTKIKSTNVQRLLNIQKKHGEQIAFFPLDIKYQDIDKFRSDILLKVGEPIKVKDDGLEDLTNHLAKNIELLEA